MLVQCLYASRVAGAEGPELVASILSQSRRNNGALGITGLLCIAGGVFIQVLEGGRDEVSDLYNRIATDPRHTHVRLLRYTEIDRRSFAQWSMGQVDLTKLNAALLLRYYKRAQFDPFGAPADATLSLLVELLETGAIGGRNDAS